MENCPKTLFFLGNDNNIWKFCANSIVRNFVAIWEAPSFKNASVSWASLSIGRQRVGVL